MTGEIKLTGMVLLAAPANEYDKRVVLLTKERGKITAFAKGAKKPRSQFSASTRPFAFGEFTVYEGKTAYNLISAEIQNYFEDIVNDMDNVYYGFYFLELAEYLCTENSTAKRELILLYQSMRALLHPKLDNRLVRRIFELKMLAIHGEYPNVFECMNCGNKESLDGFSMKCHGTLCSECHSEDEIHLKDSTIYSMQYIISAEIGKLFQFQVSDEVLRELEMLMNRFMNAHIDRKMNSLEMLDE